MDVRNQSGAQDGTRIRDLFLTKEVLYRLSYMGTWYLTPAQYVKFRGPSKYGRLQRTGLREENHPLLSATHGERGKSLYKISTYPPGYLDRSAIP